nr:ribonuclease H-like domain-containing protein [Tanacetum cinerariifolium]
RKESYRQRSKAEEKSSKALMAIDGIGSDWSYMENEEYHALVADGETLIEFALMANTENKVFDNSLCSKDCKKNNDSLNSKITELKSELSDSKNYWYSYKLGVAQLEERLNEYKDREEKYIVKIRTLETYRESNLESIKILTNEVETLKEEKDVVDGKLARLLKSSKDLENIIESQRNDLDFTSLDDLYNHLKVYEAEVQKKPNTNSQDMSFISSSKNSNNEDGNTICSNGSQIKFEDINQIDEDDIEEMDIKWNMALLSMRADKFWKRTGKKTSIQGSDVAGFVKSKVECFNCHKMGHFAREC